MKAWLVTWDWTGEYAKVENPLVAVLNSRRSAKAVLAIVECEYIRAKLTWKERLEYAKNKKTFSHFFLSGFVSGTTSPWGGSFMFGQNPFLCARLVDGLRVVSDEHGKEKLIWKEIPKR